MVPLSTLMTMKPASGTEITDRFNLFRSVEITGVPAPGYTSGQAMTALEETPRRCCRAEMGYAYSGFSYQEKTGAAVVADVRAGARLRVPAACRAIRELETAVGRAAETPLVALGAFLGVWIVGYDNNVFVQVGLIMLVGLAAKNAILIVEFAKAQHESGLPLQEAALEAAKLRFRPILMTAFAFIMGVVPLMLAHGAGAAAQTRMGTAVFSGMLVATLVGVFLIPGLFAHGRAHRVQRRRPRRPRNPGHPRRPRGNDGAPPPSRDDRGHLSGRMSPGPELPASAVDANHAGVARDGAGGSRCLIREPEMVGGDG